MTKTCEAVVHIPDWNDVHEDVASTRVAFRIGAAVRFSELVLVPVVAGAGQQDSFAAQRWQSAEAAIAEALDRWLGGMRRTVYGRLYPYEWISSWPAEALRAHVLSTVPGCGLDRLTFRSDTLDLPAQAPHLAFICMVVSATRGWPQLPAFGEDRFRKVTALALQGQGEQPPIVLSPGAPPDAVLDGLFCWLQELDQAVLITGWTANPAPANADVVKITLTLGRRSPCPMQFVVRRHQLGPDGLRHLLRLLSDTAPMLDKPVDVG